MLLALAFHGLICIEPACISKMPMRPFGDLSGLVHGLTLAMGFLVAYGLQVAF